jgi:hypothetical protein
MTRRALLCTLGSLSVASAQTSRVAPDYTVTLLGGRTVKLSDYRGKVLAFACILTT